MSAKKDNNNVFIVEKFCDDTFACDHDIQIFKQFKDANNFILDDIKETKNKLSLPMDYNTKYVQTKDYIEYKLVVPNEDFAYVWCIKNSKIVLSYEYLDS